MDAKDKTSDFVDQGSVVRRIWGQADTVMFIFAGAAAEFALNPAVDWLFYTGKLPSDPLGRFFSTVAYARKIVFADRQQAEAAIGVLRNIHREVEQQRGYAIPDEAYRDVLFMLIHYSISAHELLNQPLSREEKNEVFLVFTRVGMGMGINSLPESLETWEMARASALGNRLMYSSNSSLLYRQYRKKLGPIRFVILKGIQHRLAPPEVCMALGLGGGWWVRSLLPLYRPIRHTLLARRLRSALLPSDYRNMLRLIEP